jgi:hypothetical protein
MAWLYPGLMNIYGDRGNVLCLQRRCEWRGIGVTLTSLDMGDPIKPDRHDLYFIGGGQDREQRVVASDLCETKGDGLREGVAAGAAVLAICGGYQLLGHEYRDADGTVLRGVGLLDLHTEPARPGEKRIIGNLVAQPCFPGSEGLPSLVGFENHGGRTILGPSAQPLARVIVGGGNNGRDGLEGCVSGAIVGSYLHGSLLPKNPWLADRLIGAALRRAAPDLELAPLDDRLEEAACRAAIERAKTVRW